MNAMKDSKSGPTSGGKILAAFIPTFLISCIYITVFVLIRNYYRKVYAPRTFLGTVAEKDRTPVSRAEQYWWFRDFRNLSDRFVLKHNSLDAYLYLRFLKFVIWICFAASCLTFPILLPVNATGGGSSRQLDKVTFGNIDKNSHIWAHVVIAWVLSLGIFAAIAWERLQLIGTRKACYINDEHSSKLSARTVLFLNVPREALQPANLKKTFGEQAIRSWPVTDTQKLDDLVQKRNDVAFSIENAQLELIARAVRRDKKHRRTTNGTTSTLEAQSSVPSALRPTKRQPPVVGSKVDRLDTDREQMKHLTEEIEKERGETSGIETPDKSAVFVAFESQQAAHVAFQQITFQPRVPLEDRFLAVQPKEVLWQNLARPVPVRLSKASLALIFVIAFTLFFSIPIGIIGTLSNARVLADRYSWLGWLKQLPPPILDLLTGLLPPFLTSWFTSYVPKLFRHIAKLSGEPTIPQAELKTQAWYLVFQVLQVFLVTTFSAGAAAVVGQIAQDPSQTPALLAANLPTSANFYLTYIILQGTTSAANNLLNYSDLFEYLFYEHFWDKTPRQKFNTYAKMKGTPWAAWYPKFTNLFIIAIAYACIAPLVTGFAAVGIFFYYLSYRYGLMYVRQTKIDTRGEAYKRALQQMPTALYLAELGLIGLCSARGATAQTAVMIVLLVITAIANFLLDRMLRPLELLLGVDKWQQQEVPLLAEEDGIDPNDQAGLHAAAHGRRLGIKNLPDPAPRWLSDFFDSIISSAHSRVTDWLEDPTVEHDATAPSQLSEEEMEKAYMNPVLTSKPPKLWIPRDLLGVSREEIAQNEAVGLTTSDEGAELDEKGRLVWDHNFENVPIWSKPKVV